MSLILCRKDTMMGFFHDVGLCIIIYVFLFIQLKCVIQVVQNRNSKAIHHKYIWYTNVEQIATNIDWHFFFKLEMYYTYFC